MAKVYFYWGAMKSSKTMNLLMAAYNYEDQGKNVLVFTSGMDDRAGKNVVKSRVGPSREAIPVYADTDIYKTVKAYTEDSDNLYCILMDEVQFYTEENIRQISDVADYLNIPVLAYGLKTDFRGKLFEGAKALLEQADKLVEIKTVCVFCNKKATHSLRTNDNVPVYTGEVVQIGDEEYFPVCRKHHKNPPVDGDNRILRAESLTAEDVIVSQRIEQAVNPIISEDVVLYETPWRPLMENIDPKIKPQEQPRDFDVLNLENLHYD